MQAKYQGHSGKRNFMDIPRLQCKCSQGVWQHTKMKKERIWYVSFYYEDWTGAKKRKVKRGFRASKEALNFEAEYKRTAKADMDMTMGEFVEVYLRRQVSVIEGQEYQE